MTDKEQQKKEGGTTDGRHEIAQVNGLVITIVMALVGCLLVAGLGLWLHNISVFRENLAYVKETKSLYDEIRTKKNEIVSAEGVSSWLETSYAKKSPSPEELPIP